MSSYFSESFVMTTSPAYSEHFEISRSVAVAFMKLMSLWMKLLLYTSM